MIPPSGETDLLKQNYYSVSGTVLKRKAGLKGSQSLMLFLKGLGIVWASAPSVSSKNCFGGASEPMVWSVFTLYKSPNRLFIKSAEVKEDFLSVRTTPGKLAAAIELYRIIPKMLYIEHENNEALKLLWNCMLLLEDGIPPQIVKFRFFWRLLRQLGLAASLSHCVNCSTELKMGCFAAIDGLLCKQCATGGREISKEKLHAMQIVALMPQKELIHYLTEIKNTDFSDECKYLMSLSGQAHLA